MPGSTHCSEVFGFSTAWDVSRETSHRGAHGDLQAPPPYAPRRA